MSRARLVTVTRLVTMGAAGYLLAAVGSVPSTLDGAVPDLSGQWRSSEYKVALSSDLDMSVWGSGTSSVRQVDLTIGEDGNGVLRVHREVVDAEGRTKPFSATVVEAQIRVEMPDEGSVGDGPLRPEVTVLDAEERFLDGDESRTLSGLAISLHVPSLEGDRINVRFDTAKGRGSFGDSLNRSADASGGEPAASAGNGGRQGRRL